MSRIWIASFASSLVALSLGCSHADTEPERLTAQDKIVQLLSAGSQQVVTPSGLTLKLIATVTPPTVGSTTVQANSFWLDSNMAYIAYNNQGLPVVGAIDAVDLTSPASPRLVSQMAFPTEKINGLAVSQESLYFTGGDSSLHSAVVGKIALSPSGQLGTASEPTRLSSYAGTGIAARGNSFYATSGDSGDLSLFDSSLKVAVTVPIADARGVAVSPDGKTVGVVSGQPGAMSLFDRAGAPTASYTLGGASIPESKSTIQIGARLTLVSLGNGGFAVVCTQNGAVVASEPAVTIADASAEGTVTNAAAAGAGLVFTANGAAGVYVYRLSLGPLIPGTNCTSDTLTLLGYLDLGNFSANMVYFRNNYLFLADGLGGFRILTVQNAAVDGGDDNFANPGTGLVVLNSNADSALNLTGNGTLSVNDGFVYVDSTSARALTAVGNSKIAANATFVAGRNKMTGNAAVSGSLVLGASPLADPLGWLPVPATTDMPVMATAVVSVADDSVQTLNPGIYQNGINLSGNAQVTLNPGVYYITEGGLSVSGNVNLTGQGVLIYNASTTAGISLSGTGSMTLMPTTTGTYAGITIFQNRTSTAPVSILGDGALDIRGTLYMARAPLTLSGNAQTPTLGSLDVADTITIVGNGSIALSQ